MVGKDRKYKKAAKKYQKCMNEYKDGLAKDQQKMMASTQHGLNQEQADKIMGNMKIIQAILQPIAPNQSNVNNYTTNEDIDLKDSQHGR